MSREDSRLRGNLAAGRVPSIVSHSPVHRLVALVAAVALAAALPMVLCSQVEACAMETASDRCDMAPGSECCDSDAVPSPASSSALVGAALASLQAPVPATATLASELSSLRGRPSTGTSPEDIGSPVEIYTLLAILLI